MKRFIVITAVWTVLLVALVPLLWASTTICSNPITIDHTKVGNGTASTAEDVNHFIVSLAYTDNRFKYITNGGHSVDGNNGNDVRPYSDTCTTAITGYEKQYFNGTTGQVLINVKRDLSHTTDNTTIKLCNGDPALNTDGSSASGTYNDAGLLAVYHFEDAGGSTLNINDALGNYNGVSTTGTVGVTSSTGGVFGAGATIGASGSYVRFPNTSPNFWFNNNINLAAEEWMKTSETITGSDFLFAQNNSGGVQFLYWFGPRNIASYGCCSFSITASDANFTDVKMDTAVNDGTFRLFTIYAAEVNSTTWNMNATQGDGQNNTVSWTGTNRTTNHTWSGTPNDTLAGLNFTAATLDELRLFSSATRNSAVNDPRQWIWTLNNMGNNPGTFAVLGSETCVTTGNSTPLIFVVQSILNFLGLS